MNAVLDYIGERSPKGGRNVKRRLQGAIDLLATQPRSGQLTGKGDFRRIVANPYPYLIFYRVTADEVIIHSVRHTARRDVSDS